MSIKPLGEVERSDKPKKGYMPIGEPQVEIAAWCPDKNAQLPPTQIHFIFHYPANMEVPPIVIRFKSPHSIGFFIEELIRYRRVVWPDSEKVTGEE